jgi:hypothetical protein
MKRRQTLAAYLALLGLVLHALWPLIAQARPKNVVLVPVCTVEGVAHYLEVPGARTPLDDSANSHQEHCAYCFPATLQTHTPLQFDPPIDVMRVESGDTDCDYTASILIMDARGPPFSPLVMSTRIPRRENAQTYLERRAGALAAAAGSRFMRIGVLLG